MTGPLAGGFLGLTGLWPEGCGIAAFGGDAYKVSVTELVFVSPTSQGKEPELPFQGRGYILPRSGHQNPHGRRPCQTLEPSGQGPRQSLEPSRPQGVSKRAATKTLSRQRRLSNLRPLGPDGPINPHACRACQPFIPPGWCRSFPLPAWAGRRCPPF